MVEILSTLSIFLSHSNGYHLLVSIFRRDFFFAEEKSVKCAKRSIGEKRKEEGTVAIENLSLYVLDINYTVCT